VTSLRDRHPEVEEAGRALLLPGRTFGPSKPLLEVAADVLLAHGWAVREVRWEVPEGLDGRRATAWVVEQVEQAADGWAQRPLLVGKSLASRAAGYAAKNRLDAVWLTPLLRERGVVRGIRRNACRQLLVGGTADALGWDGRLATTLGADVLELPDADHGLVVKGDPGRTAAYRSRLGEALDGWLAAG